MTLFNRMFERTVSNVDQQMRSPLYAVPASIIRGVYRTRRANRRALAMRLSS